MKKNVAPMPTVCFEGRTYKLRSRNTVVPDFSAMDRLSILVWINRNTTKKGYSKAPDPLIGLGNAITITES